ncbi:response regulator [Sansalvadorimonas sp. 2012CJ34-2]|uniref:histidine kinase n=1 Tax=Parendozoicomonas callyspongiae TaxID=2942213 RepID=A0ABT0PIJ6_9GAMM|nr:response regulator [Sansalvadorimonas sp. 2012CJ34-2]MCL6271217.1 response regulator [Sansalvadorimonas sp. 2012CJ34-2]
MFKFSKLSIERKLRYAMMTTAEIGLLFSLIVYSVTDYMKSKEAMMERMQNLAEVFATNSQAAVYFEDEAAAQELLLGLEVVSQVNEAHLLLKDGSILASYIRDSEPTFDMPMAPPEKRLVILTSEWMDVGKAISFQNRAIGTILIRASLAPLYKQITINIASAVLITIIAIIISYIAAFRLQRVISNPITELAGAMKQVSASQIFSSPVKKKSDDEIGQLYDSFDEMLTQIQKRDEKLNKHKEELERTVHLRTEALNIANQNLKQAMTDANDAKEAALDAAKAKSSFLANMSHEIRTPMNGVLGMLDLLKDTELDRGQKDYLDTAYGSADALLQIINDILDFSKIEAGKLELEKIDMSPSTLAEDVSALLASRAREKKIELSCYTDVNMPPAVKGDPVRLRQVLTNLLGNAVKFTESGEVVVRALYNGKKSGEHIVRFEVEDTGIGIPADVVPKLFQPFTQADGSTTRKFGGTGLGLTISRQLVELMDGELQVKSTPGEGSCFFFEIEMGHTEGIVKQPKERKPIGDIYALVVDDNHTNREIMHKYLEAWGIDHTTADCGARALEKMQDAVTAGRPFDIAYLDMQMPEMDGIALSKAIASDPSLSKCRRIMLTSAGQMKEKEQVRAKLHGSLSKPFRQSQVLDLTMEVMNREVHIEAVPTPGKEDDDSHFSQDYKLLLVEDNPVNQKVALAMLKKIKLTNVDVAVNGQEAVEMSEKCDYDLVLMDCQMPVMSGYEATGAIRKREVAEGDNSRLNIIAMTANAMEGDREKCIEAGMDDYISKPIKVETLQDMLTKWLEA